MLVILLLILLIGDVISDCNNPSCTNCDCDSCSIQYPSMSCSCACFDGYKYSTGSTSRNCDVTSNNVWSGSQTVCTTGPTEAPQPTDSAPPDGDCEIMPIYVVGIDRDGTKSVHISNPCGIKFILVFTANSSPVFNVDGDLDALQEVYVASLGGASLGVIDFDGPTTEYASIFNDADLFGYYPVNGNNERFLTDVEEYIGGSVMDYYYAFSWTEHTVDIECRCPAVGEWETGDWECNFQAERKRTVTCVHLDTGLVVTNDQCDSGDMPDAMDENGCTCEEYCSFTQTYCQNEEEIFPDQSACLQACANYPGGMKGDTSVNSLACRIYHLGLAANGDAAVHCQHASQPGGDVCVDVGGDDGDGDTGSVDDSVEGENESSCRHVSVLFVYICMTCGIIFTK